MDEHRAVGEDLVSMSCHEAQRLASFGQLLLTPFGASDDSCSNHMALGWCSL